jgi:MoaA/NifB/PqqE/SkfB family radical SAM enzyme
MSFPRRVSLTITNACNLRCKMCGQWSETGYIRRSGTHLPGARQAGTRERGAREPGTRDLGVYNPGAREPSTRDPGTRQPRMRLDEWKRLVDEMADNGVTWVLVRGGEPFMFRGIMELLTYLRAKGLPTSVDTNATMLKDYAADLVSLGGIHMTVSVDGPEEVHDSVRGVEGTFRQVEEGLAALRDAEEAAGRTIARSICFTISPYSLRGLGEMPDVARRLGIPTISIVPYYYFPEAVGRRYEDELGALGSGAYSWHGFEHEDSGVDFEEFKRQLRRFRDTLGSVKVYPYMDFSDDDYRRWFADATTPVGRPECWAIDDLIDIQPGGEANFCVDFPDYSIGNVRNSTIRELWDGERAATFREYRRRQALAVCHRCGAKYMSAPADYRSA